MAHSDGLKQEVLRATDIVTLVSSYNVHISGGGRNMKALCPFHQEKTPSFTVSPERQSWHCWGKCSTGGNAIDFVMKIEGIEFMGALQKLADRAGIRLAAPTGAEAEAAAVRLEIFQLNAIAAEFYRKSLLQSRQGEHARRYVIERGIDEEAADRFQIGYAPTGGQYLLQHLAKRGYRPEQAARAGLAGTRRADDERGAGHYDWFRGRLMFPIHDAQGRVTGFGGRTFSKEERQKYINTPQSPVFQKGHLLYGLHLAKQAARERGEIAIVEGYTDVILAHQSGFPFFVATLGTAFGREHAKQIRSLVPRVLVFFDTDDAGIEANVRGLQELASATFGKQVQPFDEIRVGVLPDGQDPADAVLAAGPQALADAIENAHSIVDFLVAPFAKASPGERARHLERAVRVIASMPHDILHYAELQLSELAQKTGVSEQVVRELARKIRLDEAQKTKSRDDGVEPSDAVPEQVCPALERWALECLIAVPDLVDEAQRLLPLDCFEDPRAREIAQALYSHTPVFASAGEAAQRLAASISGGVSSHKDYVREWPAILERWRNERGGGVSAEEFRRAGCTDEKLAEISIELQRRKAPHRVNP